MPKPTEALKRLARATRCSCGHWPHDLGCAFLRWCVRMGKAGFCATCGCKLARFSGFDEYMQMVGRIERCRNGCVSGQWYCRPTPHDIRRFKLRRGTDIDIAQNTNENGERPSRSIDG